MIFLFIKQHKRLKQKQTEKKTKSKKIVLFLFTHSNNLKNSIQIL